MTNASGATKAATLNQARGERTASAVMREAVEMTAGEVAAVPLAIGDEFTRRQM